MARTYVFFQGCHIFPSNSLRWNKLILNFPGDLLFDPSMPFVYEHNEISKTIANDGVACVDDLRAVGWNAGASWLVGQRHRSRW